jgi:hypothetical protein
VPDDAKPASPGHVDHLVKTKALESIMKHLQVILPKMKEKYESKEWFSTLESLVQESATLEETGSAHSVNSRNKRGSTSSFRSVMMSETETA